MDTRGDMAEKKLKILAAERENKLLEMEEQKRTQEAARAADERAEKAAKNKHDNEMQLLQMKHQIAKDAEAAKTATERVKLDALQEERRATAAKKPEAATNPTTAPTAAPTTTAPVAVAPAADPATLAILASLADTVGALSNQSAATSTAVRAGELSRAVAKAATKINGGTLTLSPAGEEGIKNSLADVAAKSDKIKRAQATLKRRAEDQLDKTRAAQDQELYDLLEAGTEEGTQMDQRVADVVCDTLRGIVARDARDTRVQKPTHHCAMHGACNHTTEQCFDLRRRNAWSAQQNTGPTQMWQHSNNNGNNSGAPPPGGNNSGFRNNPQTGQRF